MAEDKKAGRAFLEVAKHLALVTAAFLAIFAVAIGLDLLAKYLVGRAILTSGSPLDWALLAAKYFILGTDLVILVVLVVKFAWRAMKKF